MPDERSVDAWAAMTQAIGEGIAHAFDALRQTTALTELLIDKGVLTREEVDARMRATEMLSTRLEALMARMGADDDDSQRPT